MDAVTKSQADNAVSYYVRAAMADMKFEKHLAKLAAAKESNRKRIAAMKLRKGQVFQNVAIDFSVRRCRPRDDQHPD